MYFEDLYREEIKIRNRVITRVKIGWLDTIAPFNTGDVSSLFLSKLKSLNPSICTKGWHTCPYCKNSNSSKQYLIEIDKDVYYDVPEMIIHYIEEHQYRPPQEFIDKILNL
jgi:hypothetical protein